MKRVASAVFLLAMACCRGHALSPQGESRPRTALCIANPRNETTTDPEIAVRAEMVCRALAQTGIVTSLVTDGNDCAEADAPGNTLWPELGHGWAGRTHLVYYEGHGFPQAPTARGVQLECPSGGLCLWSPSGERKIPWTKLPDGLPPLAKSGQWNALLVNACDSGFADVRHLAAPSTFLGFGFGKLPSEASLIAQELANPANDRNCDGVLTDRELRRTLNPILISRTNEDPESDSNQTAVLKRQADADVPLLWLERPAPHCGKEPPLEDALNEPSFAALPCALQNDIHAQLAFLKGQGDSLVESAVRYLFIVDERSCTTPQPALGPEWSLLAARAESLGFIVARLPTALAESVVRLLTFVRAFQLTMTDTTSNLVSLYDGEELPVRHAALGCGAAGAAASVFSRELLSCLPTRVALTGSSMGLDGLGCREGERGDDDSDSAADPCKSNDLQHCLALKVDGRFPTSPVELVQLTDFMTSGLNAPKDPINLQAATVRACFRGEGQCFEAPTRPQQPRFAGAWLVVEKGLAALTERTKQQTCAL